MANIGVILTEEEKRERRLASYTRYRQSEKGYLRTRRYNTSAAHRDASRRYRESHVRGPASYQQSNGRWVNLMKVDPADKAAAAWEATHGRRDGGVSSAERLIADMHLNPDVLHDDAAFDRLHSKTSKPLTGDHARRFWQRKMRATLGAT